MKHCMNMKAAFGFNKDLPGGVHSLFDEQREAVVYPSSHTLIYLDCYHQKQTFLQGHAACISAVAVSNDKRWIVSADAGGVNTLIIVWDSQSLKPVRTYHLNKSVLRMDLSDDGALIGVLTDSEPTQDLHIFEWASPSESSAVSASVLPQLGLQRDLRFNPADFRQMISNSAFKTVFWEWEELIQVNSISQNLRFYVPEISDFKTQPSAFTVSCFLPKTTAALTATVNGEVVLYDVQDKSSTQKKPVKLLVLHTSSQSSVQIIGTNEISAKNDQIMLEKPSAEYMVPGANYVQALKQNNTEGLIQTYYQYLTSALHASEQMTSTATQSFTQAITYIHAKHDGFIVTGGLDGSVRMFDFRLRLLSWYENLESGPITSISIVMPLQPQLDNQLSQAAVQLLPGATPREGTKQEQLKQQFGSVILRDFIVGTQRGSIILVPAAVFELVEPEKRRGQVLYQGLPGQITAVNIPRDFSAKQLEWIGAVQQPVQFLATDRGDLIVYNYQENQIIRSVNLVGDINASGGYQRLKGTLAQRHQEGFEQASYLVPVHPHKRIRTMKYAYITAIELFADVEKKPLLICGTSLGTCLLLDPTTLQLLSSFTHLSTLKQIKAPPCFKNEGNDVILTVPCGIKFVKISKGDVVAAVDESSQLTVLSQTQVLTQKMDLVTGKYQQEVETTLGQTQDTDAVTPHLQFPPKFVTEFEETKQEEAKRTAAGVRIHPAALLARANQKRRDAASQAGQWQNLGKLQISHCEVVGAEFGQFDLYDEVKNEQKPRKRDPFVIISKDRFLTIIDIEQTVAAVEPDKIIVDRRFRLDQEATPTAFCYLPKPKLILEDEELLKQEYEQVEGNQLKNEVNKALLSIQSKTFGPLNATMRPELQPVDQRDLLLIANDQYKIQVRQLQRFNPGLEVSNHTILPNATALTLQQNACYFQGGYPTNYPNLQMVPNQPPPFSQGAAFTQNSRLAGPLPLRKTIIGPTFAGYLSQISNIPQMWSENDEQSKTVVENKFRYRTEFEILNQTGAVKHKCQYLAFATPNKVVGLMRTPLDGANHRYVGLITSAGPILQVDVSYCLGPQNLGNTFLVSTGTNDCCSFLYQLDYPTLDLMIDTSIQQNDFAQFDPFLNQLQGGQSGEFYSLIQQYFSYAQIFVSEQKGLSPSENARAPVSMLGEMLRALGVFINNEQLQNAVAELTEEDIRTRRLFQYMSLVKKAFNEKRLPPAFDHREGISMMLDFSNNMDLKPFYYKDYEDLKQMEQYWDDDAEKNENFEQSLWEIIGSNEITLSLQDFIRILVNYRQIQKPHQAVLRQAFETLGAKGGLIDKQSFQNALQNLGEQFNFVELMDCIALLTEKGFAGQALPDHLSADEFAKKFLRLNQEEEIGEENNELEDSDE
ncbi:Putative_flagellar associated protein [Hexamita inflata]|uniref:Cilia- and flagella-associated protein 251 n=1 Tax=Hexamita inflata TaxID=28002 RepID=A0ABP1HY74_9EUKA